METNFRILTQYDAEEMSNLIEARSNMMIVSKNKIPSGYRDWLINDPDAFNYDRIIPFGMFQNDELVGFLINKIWVELPLTNIYSSTVFTKRTEEKYDNGCNIVRTEVYNEATKFMENMGFYTAYNVRSADPTWNKIATHKNKYSRIYSKYQVNDLETLSPGQLSNNSLFRQYLSNREYDIPLIFYRYFLPESERNV